MSDGSAGEPCLERGRGRASAFAIEIGHLLVEFVDLRGQLDSFLMCGIGVVEELHGFGKPRLRSGGGNGFVGDAEGNAENRVGKFRQIQQFDDFAGVADDRGHDCCAQSQRERSGFHGMQGKYGVVLGLTERELQVKVQVLILQIRAFVSSDVGVPVLIGHEDIQQRGIGNKLLG